MDVAQLYDELEDALQAVGATVGAAQAHGLLCGMYCAQSRVDKARWIAQVLENTQPKGDAAKAALTLLDQLYEEGLEALEDSDLEFQPLLPQDSFPMEIRAAALAGWCEGFLLGVGLAGVSQDKDLGPEVNELLRDFGEITQVEPEPDADEDNETAYAELVEYVRVGVLVVMEQLHPRSKGKGSPQPPTPTLH